MSLDALYLVRKRVSPIRIPPYGFFLERLELVLVFFLHLRIVIDILIGPNGVAFHITGDLQNHSDGLSICTGEESMEMAVADHATLIPGLVVPLLGPSWLNVG